MTSFVTTSQLTAAGASSASGMTTTSARLCAEEAPSNSGGHARAPTRSLPSGARTARAWTKRTRPLTATRRSAEVGDGGGGGGWGGGHGTGRGGRGGGEMRPGGGGSVG